MTTRHRVAVLALVASTFSWIMWADDIRAGICDGENHGCKKSVEVPCKGGTCVPTGGLTPGGITQCSAGTSAGYYTAIPPTSWADCGNGGPKNNPCERKSAVCEEVVLYKTKADCQNDLDCRKLNVEHCTYKSGDTDCSRM